MSVSGNEATFRLSRLAPRRTFPFNDDDGLIVVPPAGRGTYEVKWRLDAENLGEAVMGILRIVVE